MDKAKLAAAIQTAITQASEHRESCRLNYVVAQAQVAALEKELAGLDK